MPTSASASPSQHSSSVVLGISETMRRGGSANPAATETIDVADDLAGAVGELGVPFHDLVHGRLAVDRILEIRHRDAEQLQHPARLVTRHGLLLWARAVSPGTARARPAIGARPRGGSSWC